MATTTLDYLLPVLRMRLGDNDSTRYTDDWLITAMMAAVSDLERWWGSKYFADSTLLTVERNELYTSFVTEEPPVIQTYDEYVIVLMSSIIVKSGQLENMSWSLGGDAKKFGITNDLAELMSILKPPIKRLFSATRTSVPEA